MTYSALDTDLLLDGEALSVESIALSPSQLERALQLSRATSDPDRQWQTYLNALALVGFEQWLQDRAPHLVVHANQSSLLQPQSPMQGAVCNVQVGQFTVCLLAMGSLSDAVVSVPEAAIASPDYAAQLYVLLTVQEEQDQVIVTSCLRADQLRQHQDALQLEADGTYTLPLEWFDGDHNDLLLYLRCLESSALPLGITTPQTVTDSPVISPQQSVVEAATQAAINAGLWLRNQLDTVAQELAWVLLPPPAIASALRYRSTSDSPTDQFETLVAELGRTGLTIPAEARGAYRELHWGNVTLRLYALTWELMSPEGSPEWTLLMALGGAANVPMPLGVTLRIQDQDQVLVERVATPETQSSYLYGRVIGTMDEQFWVTINLGNGAIVTLPPLAFNLM